MTKRLSNSFLNDHRPCVFVDMDGVLADFDHAVMQRRVWDRQAGPEEQFHREAGFYEKLFPIPGAVTAMHHLSKVYNVYILSTPSALNPRSYMEKRIWIEDHLGDDFIKKLILSHNKGLFHGRALIDDRTRNNQESFSGEFIQFGCDEYPNWVAVMKHLLINDCHDGIFHGYLDDLGDHELFLLGKNDLPKNVIN